MTEVTTNGVGGTVTGPRPHEMFVTNLKQRASAGADDRSFKVAAQQLDKMLVASTVAEIWDADEGGTVNGQDMIDVEITIHGYDIAESDPQYDAPLGVFVLIDAVRMDNGDELLINTGAPLIIGKLEALRAAHRPDQPVFPVECVIRGTLARKGTVLKLRPIPVRAARGATVEQ